MRGTRSFWKWSASESAVTAPAGSVMKAILPDNDVQGQFAILADIWLSEEWREFWTALNIRVATFESIGLTRDAPDSVIWAICQNEQIALVTGNRNADGPDSLEATIRTFNDATQLPVFTLANPNRIL